MKILVPVKQAPDPNAIRFDASGAFAASTPRVVNEYDQYAIEEAIRLKEAGKATEVVVMTVGAATARDAIARGLGMGADRGVLVITDDADLTAGDVAAIVSTEARDGGYDLIIVGQETSDGGSGTVGPLIAGLLDLPLVSNVVQLEAGDGTLTLGREVEDGRHIVETTLPAVVCALTGLNEPRSPSLKGIMAARKKPVEEKQVSDYAVSDAHVSWGRLYAEARVVEGTIIETDAESAAKQVVAILREKKLV
ncbi:MAG: electron transfer flavoprotein subunit beta/FixA family protein [Thermomicrobiales bacterium]